MKNYESHIAEKEFIQSNETQFHVIPITVFFVLDFKYHVRNSKYNNMFMILIKRIKSHRISITCDEE